MLRRIEFAGMAIAVLCMSGSLAARAEPGNPGVYPQFLADPLDYALHNQDASTSELASRALGDPSLDAATRNRVLMAVGTIALCNRDRSKAHDAFLAILVLDPLAELPIPEVKLSRATPEFFRAIQESVQNARGIVVPPDIRTVAVGPVDVNQWDATRPPPFNPDALARGLGECLVRDMRAANVLHVLDRAQIDVLREEARQAEGNAKSEIRLRSGRLWGAQSFLFLVLNLQGRDRVSLMCRWEDTETSVILEYPPPVTGRVGSSEDLEKLEEKLVQTVLVPVIEHRLGSADEARAAAKRACGEAQARAAQVAGKKYLEYVLNMGEALLREAEGDEARAAAAWGDVATLAPADQGAALRGKAAQLLNGK